MSVLVAATADTGRTLFATLTQITTSGTPGSVWDVTNTQWASNPATNDRKITLTEGTSPNLGRYTGGVSGALGTYTGIVLKQIHDDVDADRVVGSDTVYFSSGNEVNTETQVLATLSVATTASSNSTTAASNTNTLINRLTDPRATKLDYLDAAITSRLASASYTAPDNTNIGTAATQATTAATQATAANGKLPADTTTKLAYLDAAISTRLSTAGYTAPANSTITTAAADALAAKTAAETTVSRLTATRAGYLDNLSAGAVATQTTANSAKVAAESVDGKLTSLRAGYLDNLSAGAVATAAAVAVITNTTRTKFFGPSEQQIPASSSVVCRFNIMLFDSGGNMEAPDSVPTVAAANQAGTDRSGNLGTVTLVSTGHYQVDYTVSSAHAAEQIILTASIVEGGVTLKDIATMSVVLIATGSGFTTADRTKLEAVFNKLPSKSYLTGTAAADGDVNLDTADGDRAQFKADVTALATSASITALPGAILTYVNANGGVLSSNMRGTDNALLAANYTAPNNTGIATAATQATTAATQSTSASVNSTTAAVNTNTLVNRLTDGRAIKLDNLDALVSSRSDFNHAVDGVLLTVGHGLATAANQATIIAKTNLIPPDPAETSDIPSAATIATQVDVTLTSSHGSGSWHEHSDATLAKQDAILAALGQVVPGVPSSVVNVSPLRTWIVTRDAEETFASNIIVVSANSTVTLAMDFSQLLNAGTSITVVSTVSDISGNGLTASSLAPSQDRQKAHFNVSPTIEGLRHEMKVSIATSDGQTLTANGVLRVE